MNKCTIDLYVDINKDTLLMTNDFSEVGVQISGFSTTTEQELLLDINSFVLEIIEKLKKSIQEDEAN